MFTKSNQHSNTSNSSALFQDKEGANFVQPKLNVGQPGDKYEIEADKAADQIVARKEQSPSSFIAPAPIVQKQSEEEVQKQETENEIVQQKPVVDTIAPGVQLKPLIQQQSEEEIQQKCADCNQEETVQRKPANQENASSSIENQLTSSKGGGNPMPTETRSSMESGFGADFSNVRIHTDSNAVQMNKSLGAQAFANGSDIYFNEGKYNPESTSGKHLLAHELTHTIQQGGSTGMAQNKIQMVPDWMNSAANWVGDTASGVASGVADGAAWVGGQVADGAAYVGNQVASGAEWVGDQISSAASWVMDNINSAISSGTNFLNEKWQKIQDFGSSAFDDIKNGFGNLASLITSPMAMMMSSLSDMNADLLEGAWAMLKSGGAALLAGVNSLVQGVLNAGEAIWKTVSGFVEGTINTISGLFNNTAFNLLPDSIKNGIRSAFNGLKSLWTRVSSFWTDLWTRLMSFGEEIISAAQNFIENVINYGIAKVVSMVRELKEVYDYVNQVFADPVATITPFVEGIAAMINEKGPSKSNDVGKGLANDNYSGDKEQSADNGVVQRVPIDGEERSTASLEEVLVGVGNYISCAWENLDILSMLWETVLTTFYPPAIISGIVIEFDNLWNGGWTTAYDSLYTPRNFFENPLDSLHDVWSNCLILLDFPFLLMRTINRVIGLLIGFVTLVVVLAEGAIGAGAGAAAGGVGAVPGFFAGAAAGLATMAPAGEALMLTYVTVEAYIVGANMLRLFTANQVCEKRQNDISTSVASVVSMAVALILQVLMALLARLVSIISNFLKGGIKAPVSKPIAEPGVGQPARQPGQQPVPQPARQPATAQPATPAPQPAPAPNNVIQFPSKPQPAQPATPAPQPAVPDRIAAKFEDGATGTAQIQLKTKENEVSVMQAKEEENAIDNIDSKMQDSTVVQKADGCEFTPDPCEEEQKELPKTVVHPGGLDSEGRPTNVLASPLTYKQGDPPNGVGSKPQVDPAGWELVKQFQYYKAFHYIDPETGEKIFVKFKDGDEEKERLAREHKAKVKSHTDWIRFHMLNENLHGPGLMWNLLSSSSGDNSRYIPFEKKVKDQVHSGMEVPVYFNVEVDKYRDNTEIVDQIHESFDDEELRENMAKWYGQLPLLLKLTAGFMQYNQEKEEYEIPENPTHEIHKNEDYPFKDNIDVTLPKNVLMYVLVVSNRAKFPSSPEIRKYLSSQVATTDVDTFVDNFSDVFPKSSTSTLLGYLEKIVAVLETPKDDEVVTLFEGGNSKLEILDLQRHIDDLLNEKEENVAKLKAYVVEAKRSLENMEKDTERGVLIKNVVAYGKTLNIGNSEIVQIFNDHTFPKRKKADKSRYKDNDSVIKKTKASDYKPHN